MDNIHVLYLVGVRSCTTPCSYVYTLLKKIKGTPKEPNIDCNELNIPLENIYSLDSGMR